MIRFCGERALFRNIGIPGADVADSDLSKRPRAIKGLIGNILGLWRDFNDISNQGLAEDLEEWCNLHSMSVVNISYSHGESRVIGQHRFKGTSQYTRAGEGGPKPVTYHWNVELDVTLEIDNSGADELRRAILQPVGTPYLGQSNCLAQVQLIGEQNDSD